MFTQDQNCALRSIVPRIMSHFREETISVLNSQYFLHVLIYVVFALISTSSCVGQWKSEMNSGGFSHFYRLFLLIVSTCVAQNRHILANQKDLKYKASGLCTSASRLLRNLFYLWFLVFMQSKKKSLWLGRSVDFWLFWHLNANDFEMSYAIRNTGHPLLNRSKTCRRNEDRASHQCFYHEIVMTVGRSETKKGNISMAKNKSRLF